MAESNLYMVRYVIYESIILNDEIVGLGYEDIHQEGCYYLCKAAATYNPALAQFDTYAKKVIRNGLISHCRKVLYENSHYACISLDEHGDLLPHYGHAAKEDEFTTRVAALEILDVLHSHAQRYSGVTQKGIDALCKRLEGNPLPQIAEEYAVPVNYVGAWISRAVAKLRKNPTLLEELR